MTIGLDIGGTKIAAAVFRGGVCLRAAEAATPRSLPALQKRVGELMAEVSGGQRVERVGIAAAGAVDSRRGMLVRAPNLRWLEGKALAPLVTPPHGRVQVRVANDARCAALAELKFGHGRTHKTFSLVTLGTGIGGAAVLGGELWWGERGSAGEIGHLSFGHRDAEIAYQRPHARKNLGAVADVAALVVSGAANAYDTGTVVLAGGAAHELGPRLLARIRRGAKRNVLDPRNPIRLLKSKLRYGPCLGATLLFNG